MRWVYILLLVAGFVGLSLEVEAQEDDEDRPDMRSRVVVDEENGAEFHRPDGWVEGKTGRGVAALFRAAGDSQVQIEIRVSADVEEDQSEYFFTSFHSSLQKEGFEKQEVRKEASYGDKTGLETEYQTASNSDKFRLIVWQYHYEDSAFLIVGFFPEKAREQYYEDYQQVIEEMKLEE